MICSDCDATVEKVFMVLRQVKNHNDAYYTEFVCEGCFAHYGKKKPPKAR